MWQLPWYYSLSGCFSWSGELAAYSKYISLTITVISIFSVLWILNKRINPSYKLGWTMLIMAFPVFGLSLYLLFGYSRIADHMQTQYEKVRRESLPICRQIQRFMKNWKKKILLLQCSQNISTGFLHFLSTPTQMQNISR